MNKRNACDGPPSLDELKETIGLNKSDREVWRSKNPPKVMLDIPPEPSPVPELPLTPIQRFIAKLRSYFK